MKESTFEGGERIFRHGLGGKTLLRTAVLYRSQSKLDHVIYCNINLLKIETAY